jgi:hypothetical protein
MHSTLSNAPTSTYPRPNWLFKGTSTRYAGRRPLTRALGRINLNSGSSLLAMVSTAKLQSPQHMREQFFGRRLLPISSSAWRLLWPSAHSRLVSPSGAASQLNLAVCPSAACSPTSRAKVPHALARWAVRPAAARVRLCAVASHSACIPQSRLAPPLLGVLTKAGYS